MTHSFQSIEEMTLQEFVLFIKIHSKQIEENTNIYLNLEPSIAEADRERVAMLLDSFLRLMTHTNIEELNDDFRSFLRHGFNHSYPLSIREAFIYSN